MQDFVRWKQQDRLLAYKPAGFSKVYAPFMVRSFSFL